MSCLFIDPTHSLPHYLIQACLCVTRGSKYLRIRNVGKVAENHLWFYTSTTDQWHFNIEFCEHVLWSVVEQNIHHLQYMYNIHVHVHVHVCCTRQGVYMKIHVYSTLVVRRKKTRTQRMCAFVTGITDL